MVSGTESIDRRTATELVRRHVREGLSVTAVRRLHGGMINSVLELATDGEPARVVAKLGPDRAAGALRREHDVLAWHRANSSLPVPEPYGVETGGDVLACSCLLMERLPGVNLSEARLTPLGREHLERLLAEVLADLHEHVAERYGNALDESDRADRWLDWFAGRLRENVADAAGRLSAPARRSIGRLLGRLEAEIPECGRPALVHGDVWATNIIVDDADPNRPRLSGLVDTCALLYADPEYELAYLLCFRTVGQEFFDAYRRRHAVRDGFGDRCRIYWLNTMLLHLWLFGDARYAAACERLAPQLP